MSVRFLCTACNTSIKAKDDYSGKAVRCPHCKARIVVPRDDQPNDVLELGEDYGLAAMSVGEIEIDSPEMHVERPKGRPVVVRPLPEPMQATTVHEQVNPGTRGDSLLHNDWQGSYRLLLRASLGLRVLAAGTAIVWLYVLGGEGIQLVSGSATVEPTQTGNEPQSPLLRFCLVIIVGGTAVCLMTGFGEVIKLLIDMRESLTRTSRR